MKFPKNVWDQLKNKSPRDLMSALEKDGAIPEGSRQAVIGFRYPDGRRVVIHYHPNKIYGPRQIKALIEEINWTIDDLQRLKLIK